MSTKYSTIIIDDEPPARDCLLKLLGNFPETFDVLDTAKNGREAKQKIEDLKPDLIFLDIEMPGLTGFELLEALETIPIVIFCTAYDEYSLKAFETNSIDYLVKPVRLERLEKTIEKLKLLDRHFSTQNFSSFLKQVSFQKEAKKMTSITVKKGDKLVFIKLEDVSNFEAGDKYVNVHTNNEIHLSEQSLTQLEQKLPDNFLSVHRAVIINTDFVNDVQKYFNSRFVITLNNPKKSSLTTGRSYYQAIKEWMNI
ncbi:LytTR family DNA-binding domain-containing protein [Wenyingzhuangia sp. chi5]|uniref:LytTR family DNA-binding domain-containing protein n=1 Tax=Wenyingzhuangia gilva TaxID=3057677 RepID=A0ABT8VTC7_9FLAO|nr:LytTR family DNA-binding domain-containing protein [Wenyingzhuangia sp. chi5]MDO3695235.1 LytTR family DNA-binding domain-containing protein [Wenyingzhuangia sp. chi5]